MLIEVIKWALLPDKLLSALLRDYLSHDTWSTLFNNEFFGVLQVITNDFSLSVYGLNLSPLELENCIAPTVLVVPAGIFSTCRL